jgi:hypothetical protein
MIRRLLPSLFCIAGCCAASDAFTPPLIGYVASANATEVRAIVGIPGAARVTLPLALPPGIERVALAPGRAFGVASMSGVESVVLLHSLGTQPAASLIVGAMKSFERAAFSPSGKAVALYGRECACIQAITGLPDTPLLSRNIAVPDRDVLALAISDDGAVVVRASTGELARYEGDTKTIWSITAASIVLSADSSTLAVVDGERKTVSALRAGEWSTVLADGDPVGVAFAGASSFVIADASAGVLLFDPATAQRTPVECACKPALVEPTALTNAFRLTGMDTGAVWLLHLSEAGTRAVFVPVQRTEAGESEQ